MLNGVQPQCLKIMIVHFLLGKTNMIPANIRLLCAKKKKNSCVLDPSKKILNLRHAYSGSRQKIQFCIATKMNFVFGAGAIKI